MKSLLSWSLVSLVLFTSAAMGRGWQCEDKQDGPYTVEQYDYTKKQTKDPAFFMVTRDGEAVVIRRGEREIKKEIVKDESLFPGKRLENTKFVVKGHKDDDLNNDEISFIVNANPDGEKLKYNHRRAGKLIISRGERETVVDLSCFYYLKGERLKELKEE